MITNKELIDYASAGLVVVTGALAGHYAAEGMTLVQWAGAATAVMGSVSVAVVVRTWSAPAKTQRQRD